jgi:hypothetical protein
MRNKFLSLLLIFALSLIFGCAKRDPVSGEIENIEPSAAKRAEAAAAKGGGIFGDINNTKKGSTTFDFATSNVLWRATLKSLDFLPLANADYSGGILIYDWYSQPNNPKEQIKISVQFLSNELRSDSIKISAHKKICDSSDRCSNSNVDQKFAQDIKESIITSARSLRIEEEKKNKK